MELIYSKDVLSAIFQYADALTEYPISDGRIEQKIDGMFNALQSLGVNPLRNPICKYADLGQSLDRNKKPKNLFLRQFIYKDKADKPWSFAYLIDEKNKRVYITSMRFSSYVVKENKSIQEMLSLIDRMESLHK